MDDQYRQFVEQFDKSPQPLIVRSERVAEYLVAQSAGRIKGTLLFQFWLVLWRSGGNTLCQRRLLGGYRRHPDYLLCLE